MAAGIIVDKTRQYKRVMLAALVASMASLLGLMFSLKPDNAAAIYVAVAALGLSALSLTPVCLELSVEVRPWRLTGLVVWPSGGAS